MDEPSKDTKQRLSFHLRGLLEVMAENGATNMNTTVTLGEYKRKSGEDNRTQWKVTVEKLKEDSE